MLGSRSLTGGGLEWPRKMNKDTCPNGCDLRADPIPQEYIDAGYYGDGVTHYSRLMGYDFPGIYDGVFIWGCPNCGGYWPRFTEGHLNSRALDIIEGWTKEEEEDE